MPKHAPGTGTTSAQPAFELVPDFGIQPPLTEVTANGRLTGLVFELTVEQQYRNGAPRNIEAVFTFPVPLRAVLLGLELEIGERKLVAQAFARRAATERYEQAIDAGDSAVLLESNGEGLYTVSVGNLAAGERASVRYRYAELLDSHRGHVRLNVPTAIAPRFGDPLAAGLEGPAVPAAGVLVEYPFTIRVELPDLSDKSALSSPSHRIDVSPLRQGLDVTLVGRNYLDRDFVLEIAQAALPAQALVARDGDGYVLLASTSVDADVTEQRPLALKILVDCSGSMGGDSIAAAKRALLAILQRLTPADQLSLSRFGSKVEHLTAGMEPTDDHTLRPLELLVRRLDANLGGTEMARALDSTLAIPLADGQGADLILITDGEIYDLENVLARVIDSGHRLFAIAIGAAPNEALARALAERTGGACEFVAPGEDAEAAILRIFERLRAVPRTLATVAWPTTPEWTATPPGAVFAGDTLHLCAGFASRPTGEVCLGVRDAAGGWTRKHLPIGDAPLADDLLPRLAAARRLAGLDRETATELAVRYQLATRYTSFVVVAERAAGEKQDALPETLAVAQMLAAGWGGHGTVRTLSVSARAYEALPTPARRAGEVMFGRAMARSGDESAPSSYDIPAFLRRPSSSGSIMGVRRQSVAEATTTLSPGVAAAIVQSLEAAYRIDQRLPTSIDSLEAAHPLTPALVHALHGLVNDGVSESDVLAVFYAALCDVAERAGGPAEFVAAMRGGGFARRGLRQLRVQVRKWLQ